MKIVKKSYIIKIALSRTKEELENAKKEIEALKSNIDVKEIPNEK